MQDETFLGQRRFLWLWVSAGALAVLGAVYVLDRPIGGRNGSTRLGYVYGGIASAGIAFLMWYGVRRRYSYAAGSGTLKGWLGAHVWIGVALAFVVPMHAGFQIAWSVHSLPYALMLLTIASGIWGAWSYVRYPSRLRAQRDGTTVRALLTHLERTARQVDSLSKGKSPAFSAFTKQLVPTFEPSFARILLGRRYPTFTRETVSRILSSVPREEYEAGIQLTALAHDAIRTSNQLVDEACIAARMRVWLYVHLPLSFACVVAVAAHVFWVLFFRWSAQ